MMGTSDPQPSMFYPINREQLVTADHPMRKIRPLIDTARIRELCEPLYVPATHHPAHCDQDDRTGGGASASAPAESDGGLPPLAASTEED